MNEYLLNLIQKYKQKGILIDTNILLLYIVGSLDVDLIKNNSRTAIFTEEDFERVSKFIDFFYVKVTTPHILTETSNLLGRSEQLRVVLKTFIKLNEEKFLDSGIIADTKFFPHFGLSDSAIIEIAKNNYLVFTNERPLYGYLIGVNSDVVNLDQIRAI